MQRFIAAAYAFFVAGGLLSGALGINHMATLATPRDARPPEVTSAIVDATPAPAPAPAAASFATNLLVEVAAHVAPTATSVAENAKAAEPWSLVYVVDGDLWERTTDGPRQLTHDGHIGQPAVGEDGLAFVIRSSNASDIWLASADGPPRAITRDIAPSVGQNHWATQPTFLAGSQRLYVLGDFNKSSTGVGDLALWELGFDLAPPVQITRPPQYAGGDQDASVDPQDPRQIVFTRYAYAGSQLVEQLQWLDVGANKLVALTAPEQPARQPSYSPDGTALAFVQRSGDAQEALYLAHIQLVDAMPELDEMQQVATGVIANPAWCPDASSLIYIGMAGEQFQVWSVDVQRDADGAQMFGKPRQMTTGPSVDASSRPVCIAPELADQVRQWLATSPT
jgi:hypothetical protein